MEIRPCRPEHLTNKKRYYQKEKKLIENIIDDEFFCTHPQLNAVDDHCDATRLVLNEFANFAVDWLYKTTTNIYRLFFIFKKVLVLLCFS